MAAFNFTITIETTPSIEVYGVNISYEEILNSFGAYFYLMEKLFIEATSRNQINQPISFNKYDSTGSQSTQIVSPNIDPYSKQPALLQELKDQHIVADGRLTMSLDVLANTWVRFTYFTCRGYITKCLDSPPNKNLVNV